MKVRIEVAASFGSWVPFLSLVQMGEYGEGSTGVEPSIAAFTSGGVRCSVR
jgi:hypothetical protein